MRMHLTTLGEMLLGEILEYEEQRKQKIAAEIIRQEDTIRVNYPERIPFDYEPAYARGK